MEPYMVWITAVDKTGKSTKGYLNINVSDGVLPVAETGFPTLVLASATNLTTVEIVFSNPISKSRLSSGGTEFKIVEKSNTSA